MHSLPLSVSTRRLVAVALALVVVAVLAVRHIGAHAAATPPLRVAPIRVATGGPARAGPAASAAVVDVEGAVRHPGLVRLPKGSRVADAVARAGGLTTKAERSGVNLAAPVADGQQVLVPAAGGTGVVAGGGDAAGAASGPISLNSATAEQLDTLPGIGPVTAQKIVTFREEHGPFQTVDGLDAIPGIGPARIAELQGLVTP